MRAPTLFGPPHEFIGGAFRTLVSSPSPFVVVHRPLHFPCAVFTHFCDGTRACLGGFPQFRIGSDGRHAETISGRIPKHILQKMVSISSTPLSPSMMKHVNMDELRRLEAKNAVETQHLIGRRPSSPRINSERLKQLRRAIVTHSKKMRLNKSPTSHRARASSEKRAKKEAKRRREIYETKRRKGSLPRKKSYEIYELGWYNQAHNFYRGSPSRRRRGSTNSPRRRRRSTRR